MSLLRPVQRHSAASGSRERNPAHRERGNSRRYAPAMATGTCESCGATDEDVVAVRRRYVTPAAWDAEPREEVVDEPEQWCIVCRTHYPHDLVEGAAD